MGPNAASQQTLIVGNWSLDLFEAHRDLFQPPPTSPAQPKARPNAVPAGTTFSSIYTFGPGRPSKPTAAPSSSTRSRRSTGPSASTGTAPFLWRATSGSRTPSPWRSPQRRDLRGLRRGGAPPGRRQSEHLLHGALGGPANSQAPLGSGERPPGAALLRQQALRHLPPPRVRRVQTLATPTVRELAVAPQDALCRSRA